MGILTLTGLVAISSIRDFITLLAGVLGLLATATGAVLVAGAGAAFDTDLLLPLPVRIRVEPLPAAFLAFCFHVYKQIRSQMNCHCSEKIMRGNKKQSSAYAKMMKTLTEFFPPPPNITSSLQTHMFLMIHRNTF